MKFDIAFHTIHGAVMFGGGGQERYRALNTMARSSALGGDSDDESVSYINNNICLYLSITIFPN